MARALVFGATGQMGSYMVELLRGKKYDVVEYDRKAVNFDQLSTFEIEFQLAKHKPDEIYNFAGINFAPQSWKLPMQYMEVNGMAVMKLLESIRRVVPQAKFFTAGSAEVFEKATIQQYEDTNRLPENPYGLSKMLAMEAVRIYKEQYKLFACTGIFFNAESPRRSKFFFAEKVAKEVARLKKEFVTRKWEKIKLGKLTALRDWGWAPEYVEVAWKMLQQNSPEDYIIGTGEIHSCMEFVIEALKVAGLPDVEVEFNKYVEYQVGEASLHDCMRAMPYKASKYLKWSAKYKFADVVRMLVEAEMTVGQSTAVG